MRRFEKQYTIGVFTTFKINQIAALYTIHVKSTVKNSGHLESSAAGEVVVATGPGGGDGRGPGPGGVARSGIRRRGTG